jgi:sugar/nucleoside kinase (ribokinase family)
MSMLAVLGNISRDSAMYPDRRHFHMLGGAALHVALAASQVGVNAAPVSVIGTDLAWIHDDPRLTGVDLTQVRLASGASCTFDFIYDYAGTLIRADSAFGVARLLTRHCLAAVGRHVRYHVCCRRPLNVRAVLDRLTRHQLPFSADFHLASAGNLIREAAPFLPHATAVFVNTSEFAMLEKLTDPSRLAAVIVSDGPATATLLRCGQITATAEPPPTEATEVTGAGDALAGTFLACIIGGASDDSALESAVTAASRSVQEPRLIITMR